LNLTSRNDVAIRGKVSASTVAQGSTRTTPKISSAKRAETEKYAQPNRNSNNSSNNKSTRRSPTLQPYYNSVQETLKEKDKEIHKKKKVDHESDEHSDGDNEEIQNTKSTKSSRAKMRNIHGHSLQVTSPPPRTSARLSTMSSTKKRKAITTDVIDMVDSDEDTPVSLQLQLPQQKDKEQPSLSAQQQLHELFAAGCGDKAEEWIPPSRSSSTAITYYLHSPIIAVERMYIGTLLLASDKSPVSLGIRFKGWKEDALILSILGFDDQVHYERIPFDKVRFVL
jgi:hypothetical protein